MLAILTGPLTGSFYALFLATPLLLTKYNYELFEFNKMLFVYTITVVIITAWLVRSVLEGSVKIRRTILDIPLFLFFLSQLVATIFSIDPHVSVWGYYGRFNGGLLSTICYILLYFAVVSTISRKQVIGLIVTSLVSGLLVSAYGIAQHFGIDAHLWVQDVQNRIFSTLGQPNWLAAYMAILTPVAIAFGIRNDTCTIEIATANNENKKQCHMPLVLYRLKKPLFMLLALLFYTTLLFTKSRSGFIGFWSANLLFLVLIALPYLPRKVKILQAIKQLLLINTALIMLTVYFGSPFQQINTFTKPITQFLAPQDATPQEAPATSQTPDGPTLNITDSGDIRKIVWEGSIEAIKANPVIGYGPETFAWAYYRFKPIGHNITSEWDFLYNKAHNEYLNYATTSGLVGLGSYLLIVGIFIAWFLLQSKIEIGNYHSASTGLNDKIGKEHFVFATALFAAWVSILITNFFGFSVVITNVYFFMIPAFVVVIISDSKYIQYDIKSTLISSRILMLIAIVLASAYLLAGIVKYWIADYHYNLGIIKSQLNDQAQSLAHLAQAVRFRPSEPNYQNELAETYAFLSIESYELDEASASAEFAKAAVAASDRALFISPYNVSYWKNRTRMYYALSQLDEEYTADALLSIAVAHELAPTDAKILYNVALLQNSTGENAAAIDTLLTTMSLKPNYRDAAWALSLYYEEDDNLVERDRWLRYILEYIDPTDTEVKTTLELEDH